jgi:hypothetical protein
MGLLISTNDRWLVMPELEQEGRRNKRVAAVLWPDGAVVTPGPTQLPPVPLVLLLRLTNAA